MQDNAAVYAEGEALVMSTRFLKEHVGIKWWNDRCYHHKGLSVDSHSWHLNAKLVTVHCYKFKVREQVWIKNESALFSCGTELFTQKNLCADLNGVSNRNDSIT